MQQKYEDLLGLKQVNRWRAMIFYATMGGNRLNIISLNWERNTTS